MPVQTAGGIPAIMIAETAYNAYRKALSGKDDEGADLPLWEELPTAPQGDWVQVALLAIPLVEGSTELSFLSLAMELFLCFHRRRCLLEGQPLPSFSEQPARQRYAWEAVARHLANVIDYDRNEEPLGLEELEDFFLGWADGKVLE